MDDKKLLIIPNIQNSLKEFIFVNEPKVKKGGEDFSQVEFFGRALLLKIFQDLGFFIKSNDQYSKNDLKIKINLITKYERMFEILLKILEKENFIKIDNENLTATESVESLNLKKSIENLQELKNNLISTFPDMKPHFILLEACLSKYKGILSGKIEANEVMFPVYSMDLVKGIFVGNKMADYFNNLIALSIKAFIEIVKNELKPNNKIKILEVGAGTGGTSVFIFDIIKNYSDIIEYYFTDISKVFTRVGQKKYKEQYPFTIFKKLDIESELEGQEFDLESFDIVFASNVVHATKNIKNTLSNIKRLLKPSGIFLLNEVTNSQDFVNLTFGLMDGWWLFEDEKLRLPNTPLLNINMWQEVLSDLDFTNIQVVSTSHQDKPDSFSQSLIIAQK